MGASFLTHALTTTLFILLQLTTFMSSSSAARPTLTSKTSTDFIRKSCANSLYPQLCYTTLVKYTDYIQTSPERLATTALSLALSATESSYGEIKTLIKTQKLKPREAAAMADCVDQISDSVDRLRQSAAEMAQIGGSSFEFHVSNVQTWVSAALTDDDTCMDGFGGKAMDGEVKAKVRKLVLGVAHLCSNALALINEYAAANNHKATPSA
ncbi:Pectinesterase [Bertholletia excelsa]